MGVCTEDFELQKQLAQLRGVPIVRLMWHGGREQFLVAPPLERKAADPEVAPRVELDAPPPTAAPKAPPLPSRTKQRRGRRSSGAAALDAQEGEEGGRTQAECRRLRASEPVRSRAAEAATGGARGAPPPSRKLS